MKKFWVSKLGVKMHALACCKVQVLLATHTHAPTAPPLLLAHLYGVDISSGPPSRYVVVSTSPAAMSRTATWQPSPSHDFQIELGWLQVWVNLEQIGKRAALGRRGAERGRVE